MAAAQAGVEAPLLGRLDARPRWCRPRRHSATKAASAGIARAASSALSGWSGAMRHEARAEQRVGPGGEDLERARSRPIDREADAGARRSGRSSCSCISRTFSGQRSRPVQGVEQLVGVGGDPEEPLRQLAPLDQRARAPAAAVDHLLVGEHGLVDRVPVDPALLAVDQAALEHVEEHRLLVAVVGGIAGGDLARPVERQAHRLELVAHLGDVGVGPGRRMDALGHRGVLGRQAEGVPAHRMQHVEALGALVAGRPRRPSCSCAHGPCGCAPTDRGTSRARSIWAGVGRSAATKVPRSLPEPLPLRLGLPERVARHRAARPPPHARRSC